ncbi:MAG TPA: EutN/CcmL family microcompartment protein [Anaerolineaceae bacterium]|jgi:ethanolamine utilization protein EutN|nr:EutN/CcmL family microcompartment protein [Anaerolineaceae bacterium]HNZ02293.1 EutN/CcmL family microcompartment protein [Anaerolineaceae bacterium]HOD44946.1 EutN/CcmL family microcompartment protein [Anaerolineaceae bacterium]HOH20716.1 EutN/CcmL family microcompartment protein [Anaerolineaceae bacterium]HOU44679.1 EutN/CcmL family microcompartment protein [Anaerolineaceae bacterium]
MYIGKVTGKVVCTVKNELLQGMSMVLVELLGSGESTKKGLLVAVDTIGCGEGNIVIVAGGGAARLIGGCQNAPIDLAVIGIVDHQIQQI